MQLNRSVWWFILFYCRIVECDEEKIKRAIYTYQPQSKDHHGKSSIDHFDMFRGESPFEQVLAALGISGKSHSNIHTTVEYWPPDMDREKFYQMSKGGDLFPFVSWNYEPNASLKKTTVMVEQPTLKALNKKPEKVYNSHEDHSFPVYVEQKKKVTTKQPEFKWIEKPSKAPKIKIKEEKAVKEVPKYYNSKYHHTPSYEINEEIIEPLRIIPKVIKNPPKIIEDHRAPTTTFSSSNPKFYIHTSKLPAQHVLSPVTSPPSNIDITSSTEDSFILINDAAVTDSGPVVFPQSTTTTTTASVSLTTRNDFQRGINIKEIFVPHKQKQQLHHREHEHEHVLEVKNQDLQAPPRVHKRRKLKKKVKTSSIAHDVVNIGNRGSSGTKPPPTPFVEIISPQTSTVEAVDNSYVDPKYSDLIDNLSKLTELSFNFNSHYNTGINDDFNNNTESLSPTLLNESPTTEIYHHHYKSKNSSLVHDDNVMVVLDMMRESSSNISSSSVEELKKAVIDNDLPKVKRIVKHHMENKPVISTTTSTEVTSVTRGKISRSRFGTKAITSSITEKSSLNSTLTSTVKPKIRKPVSTTGHKQVISTTKSSRRHNNRTRPSTTPRATTTRSTKSIARRITTRKSIKTTTLSS